MRRALQIWLTVFGLVCVAIALSHLFFGTRTIIGAGPVDATVDSDMRFYALLFAAYGAAYVWAARDVVRHAQLIELLGVLFALGGFSRLLALADTGRPHWFYLLMIPVELVIPVVNHLWLRAVRTATPAPAPVA